MHEASTGNKATSLSQYFPVERIAACLMFLINGYVFGSWAPRIPEFASRLGLDTSQMGLMILVFGIGSLSCMPVAGAMCTRYGSHNVVRVTAFALIPALILISITPGIFSGIFTLFYFGGSLAAMDVAINANAVAVEKKMKRAILASCHAFWSLGGLIGAASGGFLLGRLGGVGHAVFVSCATAILLAIIWNKIFSDSPHPHEEKPALKLPRNPLPWLVGVVALFSMIPEGSILDWGAYYLRDAFGASDTMTGFGIAAFSLTMAIMRFGGDLIRDRLGAVKTMRLSACISIVGLLIAGLAPSAGFVILGFAIAGIGTANLVPIAFSMGGNLPNIPSGIGLSIVTTMGYSGILVAPSVIGFAAQHGSFSLVFTCMPILLLVVLGFSGIARYADNTSHKSAENGQ